MASFFNIGSRFGRGQPKPPSNQPRTVSPNENYPPQQQQLQPPPLSRLQSQTSFSSHYSSGEPNSPINGSSDQLSQMHAPRRVPFFFREENSGLIVKGNLMTLAAKPEYVEKGEWLAHQVVEQYRILDSMLKIVQEVDATTSLPVCNPHTCPTMAAGGAGKQAIKVAAVMWRKANNTTTLKIDLLSEQVMMLCEFLHGRASEEHQHILRDVLILSKPDYDQSYTYTWLDKAKNPIKIPAAQYIHLVQQWILSKINDANLFPTDTNTVAAGGYPSGTSTGTNTPIGAGPTNLTLSLSTLSGHDWVGKSSGFPENFETDIKNLYRQMFRCYAHLYHCHWLDPFYHLSCYKELNTCFIHFVNVGRLFDLLEDKDVVPMQPLIDIWLSKGLLLSSQAAQAQVTLPVS